MISVKREGIKNSRKEHKKNIKPDNKKLTRNIKKYHDNFDHTFTFNEDLEI